MIAFDVDNCRKMHKDSNGLSEKRRNFAKVGRLRATRTTDIIPLFGDRHGIMPPLSKQKIQEDFDDD